MFVPIKHLFKIIFLFLFIFFYVQGASQSQINGYDFITNLKNDANIGQIDFYVKSSDPCSIGNEKILFGINSTILNTNLNSFLNFKLQVVDCNGMSVVKDPNIKTTPEDPYANQKWSLENYIKPHIGIGISIFTK